MYIFNSNVEGEYINNVGVSDYFFEKSFLPILFC